MEIIVLFVVGLLLITIGLLIEKRRKLTQPVSVVVAPTVNRPLARINDNEPAFTRMPGWDAVTEDPPTIEWGQVFLHACAIVFIQILLGVAIGFAFARLPRTPLLAIAGLADILTTFVGLTIAGLLAHGDVGKHIVLVSLLLWFVALSNVFINGASLMQWFFGGLLIASCALIAWGISKAIRGSKKK